jgi:hypothetical protein
VSCADSRVAPEILFDAGIGDIFVVRLAGNVIDGAGITVKGSIEYAVAELRAPLILVLGHSDCGAVKAAKQHVDVRRGQVQGILTNVWIDFADGCDDVRGVLLGVLGIQGDTGEAVQHGEGLGAGVGTVADGFATRGIPGGPGGAGSALGDDMGLNREHDRPAGRGGWNILGFHGS